MNRASEQLAATARTEGIVPRQRYARAGEAAERQAGRYAHARQLWRMRRELRRLRTWLGRENRDVEPKGPETVSAALSQRLAITRPFHAQRRDSKSKLYAQHAPEVECIARGKAGTPYELGTKVSVASPAR